MAEKRSTTKKTSSTTSSRKRQPSKKSSAATSSSASKSSSMKTTAPRRSSAGRRSAPRAPEIAVSAVEQLGQLTGRAAQGVTAVERDDDGWRVEVEVVELERIPHTTDVLAGYEVRLDESGELTGYHRVRRYVRGATEG
jgi:hypothetical protein